MKDGFTGVSTKGRQIPKTISSLMGHLLSLSQRVGVSSGIEWDHLQSTMLSSIDLKESSNNTPALTRFWWATTPRKMSRESPDGWGNLYTLGEVVNCQTRQSPNPWCGPTLDMYTPSFSCDVNLAFFKNSHLVSVCSSNCHDWNYCHLSFQILWPTQIVRLWMRLWLDHYKCFNSAAVLKSCSCSRSHQILTLSNTASISTVLSLKRIFFFFFLPH